jgi:hypothetical protein
MRPANLAMSRRGSLTQAPTLTLTVMQKETFEPSRVRETDWKSMTLSNFVRARPYLYHFTCLANLGSVRNRWALLRGTNARSAAKPAPSMSAVNR